MDGTKLTEQEKRKNEALIFLNKMIAAVAASETVEDLALHHYDEDGVENFHFWVRCKRGED